MKIKILFCILFCILISSCAPSNTSSLVDSLSESASGATTSNGNNEEMSAIEKLRKKHAVFFKNLIFEKSDKNYVYIVKDNEIIDTKSYPLVEFNEEKYNEIIGMNIIDAVEIIGIPTYIGENWETSLDYSNTDYYIRRIFMKNQDGNYIISECIKYLKGTNALWVDPTREDYPTLEDVDDLKLGMCIDEVIIILGKENSNRSSTGFPFFYYLSNKWTIFLDLRYERLRECEHIKFGTKGGEYDEYLYLKGYSIYDQNDNLIKKLG